MLRLRVLGAIDLRRADGEVVEAVLRQPKRLALLAYLAASPERRPRRRDVIAATFWPEFDDRRARDSLSAALGFLRRSLGASALAARGEEEIGVDPGHISSDVGDFIAALDDGRDHDALALYGGELLPGLHVAGAAGFEAWLESERARLHRLAAKAAGTLADRAAAEHRLGDAAGYAARAAELAPDDEQLLRRLIAALDATGDRAGAIRSYESFAVRLAAEYDTEPSAETKALAARLRVRPKRGEGVRPGRLAPPTSSSRTPVDEPQRSAEVHRRPIRRLLPVAIPVLGAAVALGLLATSGPTVDSSAAHTILADVEGSAPSDVRSTVGRLLRVALEQANVLLPVGDDEVRQGLATMLRPYSLPLDATTSTELAYRGAVRTVVAPALDHVGGTFVLSVRVLDAETGRLVATEPASSGGEDGLIPAADQVVERLHRRLGARAEHLAAARPLVEATTASFAAYRKFVQATRLSGPERELETRELLREALALDSTFAMAWHRLGTSWANSGNRDSMFAALRQLERYQHRGTEREQLSHRATSAVLRSDYVSALAIYDRLVRDYGPQQLNNRGLVLQALGRIDESIASTRAALADRRFGPSPPAVGNLRNLLVMVGRIDEARAVTDSLLPACGSRCAFLVGEQKWFTILQDEWVEAERLAVTDSHPAALASIHARRGEIRAAAELLAGARTNRFPAAIGELLIALVTGRSWTRPPPMATLSAMDSIVWGGVWHAVAGDSIVARAHAASLRSMLGTHRGAAPEFIDAAVAARAHRWREVIHLLAPTALNMEHGRGNYDAWITALPIRWLVATAYDRLGVSDSAIAMYERVLWPGGGYMSSLIPRGIPYSFAHQRLAVLHARAGRRDDALRHWEIFRAAFSNPDPELRQLVAETGAEFVAMNPGRL